ncbi:MAG: hypothetical protein M1819_005610 [Sarea resinae]|nr:MAG: hypothetical protein M1819_005610 [Sarea resinae]
MEPPIRPSTYPREAKGHASRLDTSPSSSGIPKPSTPLAHLTQVPTSTMEQHDEDSTGNAPQAQGASPYSTLAQFSYAPATQTTVVTTTTTTTTAFPPFVMRAPRHLSNLDPKLYPLATSPTPNAIKSFCFDLEGKPTYFREADDVPEEVQKLKRQRASLQASDGLVRSVTTHEPRFETPRSLAPRSVPASIDSSTPPANPTSSSRKRPASPVSISEAVGIARLQSRSNKRRSISGFNIDAAEAGSQGAHSPFRSSHRLRNAVPRTPDTEHDVVLQQDKKHRRELRHRSEHQLAQVVSFQQPPSRQSSIVRQDPAENQAESQGASNASSFADSVDTLTTLSGPSESISSEEEDAVPVPLEAAATPPATEDDLQVVAQDEGENTHINRSGRPSCLNTTAAQDLSLPSPSLSPVTAAANLAHNADYFAETDKDEEGSPNSESSHAHHLSIPHAFKRPQRSFKSSTVPDREGGSPESESFAMANEHLSSQGMMGIPSMLDSFDVMPDEMKTYVMYQLLRRCSKSTLHFVADVVNPALKYDFLELLPLELSLNIIKYLDVKSLCRAAQVSKKWRHIINSDEKAWKELFDRDGYVLTEGELKRAIKEGWGWQHPYGAYNWERDIGRSTTKSDSEMSSTSVLASGADLGSITGTDMVASTSQGRRPKRKAASKYPSRKQQKRKGAARDFSEQPPVEGWLRQLSVAEGPYAAASAAALAVPNPSVGIPSLRNLHLYKSLYQRHHLIRKSWMRDDAKPKHLAFRAHQRDVITCLQFDTDKILTGSDDNNINVYDTKTGALRTKLAGHEGGVWALQYEGNVLVSGSTDRSVRVWDIEKGICTQVFQGHTSTVRCLQILMPTEIGRIADGTPLIMPKQPLIITGSRDSSLRIWKLPQEGDPTYFQAGPPLNDEDCPFFVRALTGHHHSVRAIAAHGDTLVSGSYDCSVRVWKISTGETVHRLQGHTQKVYSVVLDHKRNRCISGSMDNLVKVWSLDSGLVLFNLEGHTSLVGLLDLSNDRLISAAADTTLRIWDPETGQCKSTLTAHTAAITCFQHDGQKVISGSDRTLKMWDVKTGECVRDLLTDLSGVWQVKFNERRCVAAVQRKNLTYIEVLDFGASRDGVPEEMRGRRIVVDAKGEEMNDQVDNAIDVEAVADD